MRITDQYFWNVIFLLFFLCLVFMATVILQSESIRPLNTLTVTDFTIIALASFRIVRLVLRDIIFGFFREQFYDAVEQKGSILLVKPENGPRRTLVDLLTCPWCFGIWAAFMVSFFYLLTPYAYYPILLLALSSVTTFLQLFAEALPRNRE